MTQAPPPPPPRSLNNWYALVRKGILVRYKSPILLEILIHIGSLLQAEQHFSHSEATFTPHRIAFQPSDLGYVYSYTGWTSVAARKSTYRWNVQLSNNSCENRVPKVRVGVFSRYYGRKAIRYKCKSSL
jgi:hypothetical protein